MAMLPPEKARAITSKGAYGANQRPGEQISKIVIELLKRVIPYTANGDFKRKETPALGA